MNLRIDWCSHEAAKYAVMHWHYSHKMPVGKLVKVGAWENDRFIGCVIFGYGASVPLVKSMEVDQTEMCELVRVALDKHESPTTRIVAIALRMLRKSNPGLKFVISFADYSKRNHVGTIYQAGNWIYTGVSESRPLIVNGIERHPRLYGKAWIAAHPNFRRIWGPKRYKLRYIYPFHSDSRKKFMLQAQKYIKRVGSVDSDTSAIPAEKGGVIPTPALQT